VGENGEGKSTMVKLLLGLFAPDKGEMLIGGRKLDSLSHDERIALFGTVFQDFGRYSITLRENIAIGSLESKDDGARLSEVFLKTKIAGFASALPEKENTLLGKDFDGGTDLSGGQWQRVAMARALFGDKPFLILDEPTSQLDPMAESALYSEFAEIADGKTSLFITHRLGSTAITDRIVVIANGVVAQNGTHDELLAAGGLYADMYNAQKSWYSRNGEVAAHAWR
jgi:ATP-binding cassette subfamily B protein